jgi:hypothetical protein
MKHQTKGQTSHLLALLLATSLLPLSLRAEQRIDLEGTAIIGNKESPNILYVVPWKKPGGIAPMGPPAMNQDAGLLAPLDRDEFRRQIDWYQTFRAKP